MVHQAAGVSQNSLGMAQEQRNKLMVKT